MSDQWEEFRSLSCDSESSLLWSAGTACCWCAAAVLIEARKCSLIRDVGWLKKTKVVVGLWVVMSCCVVVVSRLAYNILMGTIP